MTNKKGFTLVEILVVIVIMGILAAVAVPKLFGSVAKAKASELTVAAGMYVRLLDASRIEQHSIGTWNKIGYAAPGNNGQTKNFKYCQGEIDSDVDISNLGEGKIGWEAINTTRLNHCEKYNWWTITIAEDEDKQLLFSHIVSSPKCSHIAREFTAGSTTGVNCQVDGTATAQKELTPTDIGYTMTMGNYKKGGWSSAGMGKGWTNETNNNKVLENGVNVGMADKQYATQNELRTDGLFELQPNSTYTFTVVSDETDENGKNIWGNTETSNKNFLQTAIRVYTERDGSSAAIVCGSTLNKADQNPNEGWSQGNGYNTGGGGKNKDFSAEATVTTNEKGQKVTTFTITTGNEASYFGANVLSSGVSFNDDRRTAAEKAITGATLTLTATKAGTSTTSNK